MAVLVAGILLAFVSAWFAFGSNAVVQVGPDAVHVETSGWPTAMVVTAGIAVLAMVGGTIGGVVAWIGALLNTAQLADKTWFVMLLVLGLFSFGLIAMIAYVFAGPDGTKPEVRPAGGPGAA
jgi:hypothetical protein